MIPLADGLSEACEVHEFASEDVKRQLDKVEASGRSFRQFTSFLYKVLHKMVVKGRSKRE